MSAYALEDGTVYLTHPTTARGLEFMWATPASSTAPRSAAARGLALRRHDQYHDANATSQ
jgi:hypothetical protein